MYNEAYLQYKSIKIYYLKFQLGDISDTFSKVDEAVIDLNELKKSNQLIEDLDYSMPIYINR